MFTISTPVPKRPDIATKRPRPTGPFLTDAIVDRSYGIIPLRLVSSAPSTPDTACASSLAPDSAGFPPDTTQVLLIHQKSRGGTTFWALPKGHAEEGDGGETESAIRELREETGLVVRREDFLGGGVVGDGDARGLWSVKEMYWQPDLRGWKEVRFFAAVVPDQNKVRVQEKEIAGSEWCAWDRALELVTFAESEATLRACLRMLRGE